MIQALVFARPLFLATSSRVKRGSGIISQCHATRAPEHRILLSGSATGVVINIEDCADIQNSYNKNDRARLDKFEKKKIFKIASNCSAPVSRGRPRAPIDGKEQSLSPHVTRLAVCFPNVRADPSRIDRLSSQRSRERCA